MNIVIGQYLPFDTAVHRIDPRIKIFLSILFMVSIFFVDGLLGYIPYLIFISIVVYIAKIPIKSLIRGLKPIFLLLLLTTVINLLTTSGQTIFRFYFINVTYEGIYKSIFIILRLIFIIISTSILTYTTSPMQLTYGLEKMFSPLEKIGFPASEFALMISISLRFIPTLFNESEKIKMAQMARGADFESGNIVNRAKNMIPLLVPLFINSFKRAGELAVAMEARHYTGGKDRTRLNELKITKSDIVIVVIVSLLLLTVIFSKLI